MDSLPADKARRELYKELVTSAHYRNLRMQILEEQGSAIGWVPSATRAKSTIPTFPFIFAWSEEQTFEVRPCRWVDQQRAVWQPHRPNVGRPMFATRQDHHSAFHIGRQRKAVKNNLCAMCGSEVDVSDILWLNIENTTQSYDDGWSNLRFPLLHLECIRHALNGCPFFRSGFGGFAPYRGPIRKKMFGYGSEGLMKQFGLKSHPNETVIHSFVYQIPSTEMKRLQSLALQGCPQGLHWR